MKMKKMEWTHNGFHGYKRIKIMVPGDTVGGDTVTISKKVANRLNKLVCGCENCKCGERIAYEYNDEPSYCYVIVRDGGCCNGNYPQK